MAGGFEIRKVGGEVLDRLEGLRLRCCWLAGLGEDLTERHWGRDPVLEKAASPAR